MTIRHYFAEKIRDEEGASVYRFTPDSILMKDWGVVKMGDSDCEIIQLAPDTSGWGWSKENQEYCCAALYAKFLCIKKAEGQGPMKIEFIA